MHNPDPALPAALPPSPLARTVAPQHETDGCRAVIQVAPKPAGPPAVPPLPSCEIFEPLEELVSQEDPKSVFLEVLTAAGYDGRCPSRSASIWLPRRACSLCKEYPFVWRGRRDVMFDFFQCCFFG